MFLSVLTHQTRAMQNCIHIQFNISTQRRPEEGCWNFTRTPMIVDVTEKNGLYVNQISAYGADNASVNFGKHNSVFQKLRQVNPHIMKGNCKCHLIHNTLKNVNRILSAGGYDAEPIVLKIYREFSCSAKRADLWSSFASLLQHSTKRHWGMYQPVGYLCCLQFSGSWECWPTLKCYFLSLGKEDCPDIIWKVMCQSDADAAAMRMRWQCLNVSCCSCTMSCKSFTVQFWS